MHNYIIFTQINVLQKFREKKHKIKKKQQIKLKMKAAVELAEAQSADCSNSVATILSGKSGKNNVATKLNNVAT